MLTTLLSAGRRGGRACAEPGARSHNVSARRVRSLSRSNSVLLRARSPLAGSGWTIYTGRFQASGLSSSSVSGSAGHLTLSASGVLKLRDLDSGQITSARVSSEMLSDATGKKGKRSPYSITRRRISELIPVLGSQPAGDVSHKPGGRLPLLSARPAVTFATIKRAATNFAAW